MTRDRGNHKHSAANRGATGAERRPSSGVPERPEKRWPKVERRRPERRALFLAEISQTLAESFDREQTLSNVARRAMPELRAWCIVDVFDERNRIQRLAVFHPDPQLESLARELQQNYPPRAGDALGAPRMIGTQQPELVPEVTDQTLAGWAEDERHLEILRVLQVHSYMVVPLRARERLLGTLTFIGIDEEQRYTPRDLLFAEDLASRIATAMDNARLYGEAQQAKGEALEALARAAEADRAKADFLAIMSHELHTPLNAIAGYAELLELGMQGPISPQQREAIARIRQAQRQLAAVVDDILTFSRAENEALPIVIETVDVNQILDRIRFLVEPLMRGNRLTGEVAVCDPPMTVMADREKMQHIIVNLLSNAVKFSPPSSPIRIECEKVGNCAAIHVIDSGPGIPGEKLERIFEAFVQGSAGFTRTASGSGLGLAISRDLARMMGGDLTVESELGAGSRFTLTLPLGAPQRSMS
jgi:signal transduction histidine kinase